MQEKDILEKKKDSKNKIGKYLLYLFLIFGLTTLVLFLSLRGNTKYQGVEMPTIKAVGKMILDIDIKYFFIFLGILVLSHSLTAFALFCFARLYTRKYKYHQALMNSLIGTFYNDITPGSNSGGQFAQAITFKKQGLPISNAASVLVMQYIVYQSCLLILGLISLFRIDKVLDIGIISIGDVNIPIVIFIILGFLLNAIVIISILIMSYSRTLHNFILNHGVNLLGKLHIVNNIENKRLELRIQIENFRIEMRRLQSNIPFSILIFIVTLLVLIINDSFPYVVGLSLNAFNNPGSDIFNRIFESVVFTNYHLMICGLIPIPGSAGVSEFIFTNLFKNYYDKSFVQMEGTKAAMLLWRLLTYYIPFVIGAIVASTYKTKGVERSERFYSLDNNTFVTLQLETYDERKKSSDEIYETKTLERKELIKRLKLIKRQDANSIKNNEENDKIDDKGNKKE